MTFQVFNPSITSIYSGIGTIGAPARELNAVCPVLTWSHAVVSQASNVFTIPQGYKAVLLHTLYVETVTSGPTVALRTSWYNDSASTYIGCAAQGIVNTGGASTLLRVPCAMATVDASESSVQVTLRALSWSVLNAPVNLFGSRIDYLGDSWVSIIAVRS
jgi:hypothetical protein